MPASSTDFGYAEAVARRNRATGVQVRGIPVKWARDDAPGRGRPPRGAHPPPHASGRGDGPRAAGGA